MPGFFIGTCLLEELLLSLISAIIIGWLLVTKAKKFIVFVFAGRGYFSFFACSSAVHQVVFEWAKKVISISPGEFTFAIKFPMFEFTYILVAVSKLQHSYTLKSTIMKFSGIFFTSFIDVDTFTFKLTLGKASMVVALVLDD